MEILSMILQGFLALAFLMAGFGKVTGSKMHVEGFTHWKLPQWFRVVTGIVELLGAAALIVGYWDHGYTAVGALLLGITAIGGIITHIRVKDPFKQIVPILVLGVLAFILFYIHLSEFPWV